MTRHTFDRNGYWIIRVDSHEVVETLRTELRRQYRWRLLWAKVRAWLGGNR